MPRKAYRSAQKTSAEAKKKRDLVKKFPCRFCRTRYPKKAMADHYARTHQSYTKFCKYRFHGYKREAEVIVHELEHEAEEEAVIGEEEEVAIGEKEEVAIGEEEVEIGVDEAPAVGEEEEAAIGEEEVEIGEEEVPAIGEEEVAFGELDQEL